MSKSEFLNILDRKLQVINEKERKDIIDEYRTHIEMKVQDGKSEEEAIEDFGDIDELVDEILDAYKINTDRVNRSFDHKFNDFMDNLYDGFKRFISSFTSLEIDDVVKLIFEILIILIILAVMHIPFSIIGSLGSSLLRNIIGLGIGHLLGGIWKVVIELAYVVIFIVVIVNVIMKRVNRYRRPMDYDNDSSVFDDFKETFNFDQGKARTTYAHTSRDYKEKKARPECHTTNSEDTTSREEDTSKEDEDVHDSKEAYAYQRSQRRSNDTRFDVGESVTSILRIFMRIFYVLLLIPFIFIIVALSCTIGAMVVLSIQGFTLIGAYFLVVGGLFVTGAFLSLMHSVLWRKG